MLTGNYITYENIVDRVFRLGIPPQFIDDEECKEVIYDALRRLAAPSILLEKTAYITIADSIGDLPCDFYSLDDGGVRHIPTGVTLVYSSDIYHMSLNNIIDIGAIQTTDEIDSPLMMVGSYVGTPTYKLQNSHIHVGFTEGTVEMSYKAFPIDDKNNPLVPDDIRIILFVTYAVAEVLAMRLWMKDQLAEAKYREISKEAAWYIGSAQNSARMPNADQMQVLSDMWTSPYSTGRQHQRGFNRTVRNGYRGTY
jgi:hypothetical protein